MIGIDPPQIFNLKFSPTNFFLLPPLLSDLQGGHLDVQGGRVARRPAPLLPRLPAGGRRQNRAQSAASRVPTAAHCTRGIQPRILLNYWWWCEWERCNGCTYTMVDREKTKNPWTQRSKQNQNATQNNSRKNKNNQKSRKRTEVE